MNEAELERIREQFDREVRTRLTGVQVERTEVLQYGDDPEVEPGQVLARVVLAPPADEEERAFEAVHDEHREAFHELRREHAPGEPHLGKPHLMLKLGQARGPMGVVDAPGLTPVMTRLGPDELQTLDTLITAGIASSRAEAVRWALTRIRERPAYEQLRARTREIEDLKAPGVDVDGDHLRDLAGQAG
jgi:Arc/MetJ-type ribon-helix-helix transcriptional regulator